MHELIAAAAVCGLASLWRLTPQQALAPGHWWRIPVSCILAFGLFIASFGGNRAGWRGSQFRVSREDVLLNS